MTPFAGTRIIVAGDVCRDVMIAGHLRRFSREAVGVPVLDVSHRSEIEGGAAAAYRQALALGAPATLVPTGPLADKTRLIAVGDHESRQLVRFDDPWSEWDVLGFRRSLREAEGGAILYCQYRPGHPPRPLTEALRGYALRVGDVRDPAPFAGVLDVVKIGIEHAQELVTKRGPVMGMARLIRDRFGFRVVVVTAGSQGYFAATAEGAEIAEKGIDGARRVSGAGDVFSATLAVALAAKYELREALTLANRAAGLACRKDQHLASVDWEELDGA